MQISATRSPFYCLQLWYLALPLMAYSNIPWMAIELCVTIRLGSAFKVANVAGYIPGIPLNTFHAEATFVHGRKEDFENHLNPVMLVFIGILSLSTIRWVPICHGFSHFSRFFASFCIGQISRQQSKGRPFQSSHWEQSFRWVPIC